jgi:GNAT superfamily N-acetyltransferase
LTPPPKIAIPTDRPDGPVHRVRLTDLDTAARVTTIAAIDAIFFETAPAAPSEPLARAAFHDLWLGQYLRHEPHLCWLARDADGAVLGYLVGSFVDPATSPRFASLSYVRAFAPYTATHPAHLHINLTAAARGQGVGQRLVEAFVMDCVAAGLPGLHVVTGAAMRNVRFYERCGYRPIATVARGQGHVVCLGRTLGR